MAVSLTIVITQNSQSVANNTSNVTVKVNASWTGGSYNTLQKSGYLIIDGTKYTFTSSFNTGRSTSGTQTLFTKTVDVAHASDGKKTLQCSASYTTGVSSGTIAASVSKALTTIPRKSTLTASNGTLGTAQTLSVTRQTTSFTHTITYKCGSASGTVCTKSSSTSISWTPPLSLAQQNTTGTSVSITFTIVTYSGDTNVGSNTKTISCTIPSSVTPTISIEVTDSTGYKDTYGDGSYIKGLSKIKVVITATGVYGSTIKSYKTTINGKTYTSSTIIADVEGDSSDTHGCDLFISSTVTDSRNRTAVATGEGGIIEYTPPKINEFTVIRSDESGAASSSGEYLAVKFDASVTALSSNNTAAYTIQYKKTTDDTYTTEILTDYANQYVITDGLFIFAAETGSSYNVTFEVKDEFGPITKTAIGPSIKKFFSIFEKAQGIAWNKIAELKDIFDIGFQTRFSGGILPPVLEPETDLNDIRTPNTYTGANTTSYNYGNCPLDNGTFSLEVTSGGEDGQVRQILTRCHKTLPITYERWYYGSAWGDWIVTRYGDNKVIWGGDISSGMYMTSGHTATLTEAVSAQEHGIVLVFSYYNGTEDTNYNWQSFYVPKTLVAMSSSGHTFMLTRGKFSSVGTKYLYIYDTNIKGHDDNNLSGTANGITYANNKFVLRYVFGV